MMNNFIILSAIIVIIISFTLMPDSILPTSVHAQSGVEATHIESVTSSYDALLKAPMIISQAAIVGGVFNHVFLQRVVRSRSQPNFKNNKPVDSSNLQSLRRLFILLIACSLTILVTASSLIYLQTLSLSSELGLDFSATFTILTSTSVGPVWILRIITSSIIVVSSALYYISEKRKIKRTTEKEGDHTYNKQKKRNLSLPTALLYIIILSGAISVLSNSVVSHSAALSFLPSLAISIDWLHFMAVSMWIGGLFYISTILLVTIRSTINVTGPLNQEEEYKASKIRNTYFLAILLPYFSLIATISLGIIGVTGLYMAWIHLHTAGALFDTAYGNILIVKLSAILPIVLLGAYHQLRLHNSLVLVAKIGREEKKSIDKHTLAANTFDSNSITIQADPFTKFSKTIRIESSIGIAVLFITSFLTITSPPSVSMAENSNLNGSSTATENEMPSFDSFAIVTLILAAAILTGSIVSFVRSKHEIKKTVDSLHPSA
jgi:copper transport protein